MEILCAVLVLICLALTGAVCGLCFKVKRLQRRIDGLAVFVEMARDYANRDPDFAEGGRQDGKPGVSLGA